MNVLATRPTDCRRSPNEAMRILLIDDEPTLRTVLRRVLPTYDLRQERGVGIAAAPGALAAVGDVDTSFNPNANSLVQSTAAQADGKVLLGGSFTMVRRVERNRVARLNADGSLDTSFNPDANSNVLSHAQTVRHAQPLHIDVEA